MANKDPYERLETIAVAGGSDREMLDRAAEDLGFAKLDHDRAYRKAFPEVVFGSGKTPEQVGIIAERIYARAGVVLATRVENAAFNEMKKRIPTACFSEIGRVAYADRRPPAEKISGLVLTSAGTGDQRVAEEASITAELMGCKIERLNDVGVAGLQRLLDARPVLDNARVVIVVAGMDGALPSVIAGLVKAPVIAVPTSVGYGASFDGLAALLSMLNACAPGVATVNIDNGFGAGYLAAMMLRAMEKTD